ncbi:unnamed protein product [Rhizophagus irregularis]|uniref:Uncharacterized protein n=1 Tax=Rhizophagus irregularis TaxID=588596 RepID=A0A2I1GHQ1_9GLOM|nr:hypothetical protein RhiirA4_460946 [Rhizophagus irregularis]CAB4412543.1 unnamed protein product [Rhizophagus irregularis]
MKLIIIVLFLIFFKTFALKSSLNCDDIDYIDIKFLANHQVALIIDGPDKLGNTDNFACCLQQGPMIISNYSFNYNQSLIYTVVSDTTLENGYTMDNILNANNCLSNKYFDCSTIYQGDHYYTRADNYDPTKFPSPGDTIGYTVNVYAHCFNYCETTCLKSCLYTGGISYDPPK